MGIAIGFTSAKILELLATKSDVGHTHDWATGITGKPSTFPPSSHTHPVSQISNLSAGLRSNGTTPLAPGNDFNQAIDTGFYYGYGETLNTPDASLWWNLTVENSGSRSTQYASNIDRAGPVYKRWRLTPATPVTWSPWIAVSDERTLPAPFRTTTNFGSNYPIAHAASTWGSVIATADSPYLALPAPAWVKVEYGAILSASTGYARIGLAVTGTVSYAPGEDSQGNVGTIGGLTPFHLSPDQSWTQGQGTYNLPAGSYRFVLQSMRSSGSATCTCNYPMIQITPLRWA